MLCANFKFIWPNHIFGSPAITNFSVLELNNSKLMASSHIIEVCRKDITSPIPEF